MKSLNIFCPIIFFYLLWFARRRGGGSFSWIDVIRASPAVWQIELSSLIFGKNVKNTPPTVWQKTWQFLATWEKPASSA